MEPTTSDHFEIISLYSPSASNLVVFLQLKQAFLNICHLRAVFEPRTSVVKCVADVSFRVNMSNESHYGFSTPVVINTIWDRLFCAKYLHPDNITALLIFTYINIVIHNYIYLRVYLFSAVHTQSTHTTAFLLNGCT